MAIEKKSYRSALEHLFYDMLLTTPFLMGVTDFWGKGIRSLLAGERLSFAVLNVVSTVAVRAPAVYMLCVSPWHRGLPLVQQIVWAVPTALYVAYQIYVTRARIRRLRVASAKAAVKPQW